MSTSQAGLAIHIPTASILILIYLVWRTIAKWLDRQPKGQSAPMLVDPAFPPSKGLFLYDGEDAGAPTVYCSCHQRPILHGQEVVEWPQPPKYTCIEGKPL